MLTCVVPECGKRCGRSGYCSRHYHQKRANGTLAGIPRCAIDGCSRCVAADGLCMMHYKRRARGKPMEPEYRRRDRSPGQVCEAPDCDRRAIARGLCGPHWTRAQKGKGIGGPIRAVLKRGTRLLRAVNVGGYIEVFDPKNPASNGRGYILEHRKVMAECLGRPLLVNENVHHKNGDRADNRLRHGHELHCPDGCCNLELWSYWQPCGQRVRDKIAWAKEILRAYGAEIEDAEEAGGEPSRKAA